MGAWDTGPFDNDDAADFADDVDDAASTAHRQLALIRAALESALGDAGSGAPLRSGEAARAVAAAAIVAAHLPGAEPYRSAVYGSDRAAPSTPPEYVPLALRALGRVLSPDCELAQLWRAAGAEREAAWRAVTGELRVLLAEAVGRAETGSRRLDLPQQSPHDIRRAS